MKITKALSNSIQSYYHNCSLQAIQPWNKDADLDLIFEKAKEAGFSRIEACAGTFWFSYKTPKGKYKTKTTNGNLFPKFENYQ